MTDERPWLSLSEAARLTGENRETIRSRVRRGLIPSRRSNSGAMLVQVDRDATGEATGAADADQGLTDAVTELRDEITDLRERLTRAEAERDAVRDSKAEALAAKDEVIGELKAMLADARRPWWRKLLG